MAMKDLISALRSSVEMREDFLETPGAVAASYGVELTDEQIEKVALARELEQDPLIGASMCPDSGTGVRSRRGEHEAQPA